jgi:hypothetical protein
MVTGPARSAGGGSISALGAVVLPEDTEWCIMDSGVGGGAGIADAVASEASNVVRTSVVDEVSGLKVEGVVGGGVDFHDQENGLA